MKNELKENRPQLVQNGVKDENELKENRPQLV